MKNPIVILLIVTVLGAVGFGGYSYLQKNKPESMTKTEDKMVDKSNGDTAMKKDEPTKDESMMKKESRYVEYSKEVLSAAAGTRRVIFFYANWCPTCRPTDVNFKENLAKIPEDVTVVRVNYNDTDTDQEEKDLATKYGVTYQHTFVQIDRNGEVVTRWNGGQIDELLSKIR